MSEPYNKFYFYKNYNIPTEEEITKEVEDIKELHKLVGGKMPLEQVEEEERRVWAERVEMVKTDGYCFDIKYINLSGDETLDDLKIKEIEANPNFHAWTGDESI